MRVGWLMDKVSYLGGAEMTASELRAAAPADIEIVDCAPNAIAECDRYIVHNCVQYQAADLEQIAGRPTVKMWHDVGPWVHPDVRAWLDSYATPVCCSPLQAKHMGLEATVIPPPVDLDRFAAAASTTKERAGTVAVAAWRNHDKGAHRVAEWSLANDAPVDFYGGGEYAPPGCHDIAYDQMPELLASYERLVFLPTVIEPFGRVVAEAWAAGCEIVTNSLVGAKYWIEDHPEAIETAASDFWDVALDRVKA